MKEASYNRVMSDNLKELLEENGEFHWVIDYVKQHDELDFQNRKTEFSVYRGTSKLFTLNDNGKVDPPKGRYKKIHSDFYTHPTKEELDILLKKVNETPKLKSYVEDKNGRPNEGYYQTKIGRRYALHCKGDDDFLIFDKEFIISFENKATRKKWKEELKEWQENMIQTVKDETDLKKFSQPGDDKVNAKIDLMGISKNGELWIFELKQDGNDELYNSPFQIGIYYKQISKLLDLCFEDVQKDIINILKQKESLGMIKKPAWDFPKSLSGNINLAIVVGGDNVKSSSKERLKIIRDMVEKDIGKEIKLFSWDDDKGILSEKKALEIFEIDK